MIALNMDNIYFIIKINTYEEKVYVEIRNIYTDVSTEDIKTLKKKVNDLDKKYNKDKERKTYYFLIKGTDFEVKYNKQD